MFIMKIDVCKKGIPEEGIPPPDDCKPKEALQVANQVVDYVMRQAEESGVNLIAKDVSISPRLA